MQLGINRRVCRELQQLCPDLHNRDLRSVQRCLLRIENGRERDTASVGKLNGHA